MTERAIRGRYDDKIDQIKDAYLNNPIVHTAADMAVAGLASWEDAMTRAVFCLAEENARLQKVVLDAVARRPSPIILCECMALKGAAEGEKP